MVGLVLAPVVLGVALYKLPPLAARILALLGQAWFGWTAVALLRRAEREGPVTELLGGSDATVYVALRGDNVSLGLVTLGVTLFTASMVFVWTARYNDNRLLLLLLALQGLTTGIFVADDVFTLFVLFEVASLVTILLVMYRRERRNTYDGLYYLVVQLVAMTFFLFGIAYLYRAFGVLSVDQIGQMVAAGAADGSLDGRALVLPFALMLTGIGLKAGLFPLFSYVPRSYGNPGAPSIALLLMSGVLVNGALFWLARLVTLFAPVLDARWFLVVVGLLTGVGGAAKALAQRDLRLLLAYSTVSQAGLVVLGLSAGTETAHAAAMLHLVSHALAKSILFLTAAMVVRRYGTAQLREIRGLARRMPLVAATMALAILGMFGAPFTAGAVSKDLMLAGASGWVEAAVWAVNVGSILVMVKYGQMLFGTPPPDDAAAADDAAHDPHATRRRVPHQVAVVLALTAACIAIASFSSQTLDLLTGYELKIQFWPGAVKILTFAGLMAGSLVAHGVLTEQARRLRRPLSGELTLPQACLALTVFFAAAALFGTVATSGAWT